MAEVSLTVHRLNGQQSTISVDESCSIANLYHVVHAALELQECVVIKLFFGVTVLESGFGDATLQTVGISDGDVVCVTILSELRVQRHIYRAGGGAPPYRSGSLVSTEDVILNRSVPLHEQWATLVGRGDYIHLMTTKAGTQCSYCAGKGTREGSYRSWCENCEGTGKLSRAPKLWAEADKDDEQLSPYDARAAGEVFAQRNSVGIVHRLRGMD